MAGYANHRLAFVLNSHLERREKQTEENILRLEYLAVLLLAMCFIPQVAEAGETIALGGEEVPAEKFHVFVVFGDSNTFGAGNIELDWSSPRAWRMNGKGEWEQATNVFPVRPGTKKDTSRSSTGWWVLRYLTEHYPDEHFGLLQYCNTGVGEGMHPWEVVNRVYDSMIAYLDLYVGKFHFIGVVMESGMTRRNYLRNFDTMRAWFREDLRVERAPLVFSGWRLNHYNFGGA